MTTGDIYRKVKNITKLNEKSLYRALSPEGNPTLKSLLSISKALGMQMDFISTTDIVLQDHMLRFMLQKYKLLIQ